MWNLSYNYSNRVNKVNNKKDKNKKSTKINKIQRNRNIFFDEILGKINQEYWKYCSLIWLKGNCRRSR